MESILNFCRAAGAVGSLALRRPGAWSSADSGLGRPEPASDGARWPDEISLQGRFL